MNPFKKIMSMAIITICASLFVMAVIGNLFLGSASEATISEISGETADVVLDMKEGSDSAVSGETEDEKMANRIAVLRMERDRNWRYLQTLMAELQPEEQEAWQSYAMLQYREQRLELLLQARGITHCLVLLEEEQANIMVSEQEAEKYYEKIFDLVLRNSSYSAEQIVLIPVKTMES